MFIKNANHCRKKLITAIGEIEFDERGMAEIVGNDEFCVRLLKLDGYIMVDKDGNPQNGHMKHPLKGLQSETIKTAVTVEPAEDVEIDVTAETAEEPIITEERQKEYDAAIKFVNSSNNSGEEIKVWAAEKGITVEATKRAEIRAEVLAKMFPEFTK